MLLSPELPFCKFLGSPRKGRCITQERVSYSVATVTPRCQGLTKFCLIHASHPFGVDGHRTPEHPHSGIPAGVAARLWNTVRLAAERKEDAVRAHR